VKLISALHVAPSIRICVRMWRGSSGYLATSLLFFWSQCNECEVYDDTKWHCDRFIYECLSPPPTIAFHRCFVHSH
jgi:hypothetical protein